LNAPDGPKTVSFVFAVMAWPWSDPRALLNAED
jgi:hypothetical protein